jgi:hypothetical protein
MLTSLIFRRGATGLLLCLLAIPAMAQSFRVQCPSTTTLHPGKKTDSGGIKCQQISGGDGFASMGDGTQTYLFSFGPLSGLSNIKNGLPGTTSPAEFNQPYIADPSDPNNPDAPGVVNKNGAVGLAGDEAVNVPGVDPVTQAPINLCVSSPTPPAACYTGHVDPRPIMDVGVMNGNIPAPMMAIDEDDEFFLTLTNVGMIMRPDLFEQHTVHFHGYPNASAFYDGVPDASVAINIGGSFTYYYLAPDAGTYFWHCHITPPEHGPAHRFQLLGRRPLPDSRPAGSGCRLSCEARPFRALCLQRRRWNHPLRCRISDPDPRVRSQLPLRRHDLQSGTVHRHEGQVLPAERP